jgi:hypothetical protein
MDQDEPVWLSAAGKQAGLSTETDSVGAVEGDEAKEAFLDASQHQAKYSWQLNEYTAEDPVDPATFRIQPINVRGFKAVVIQTDKTHNKQMKEGDLILDMGYPASPDKKVYTYDDMDQMMKSNTPLTITYHRILALEETAQFYDFDKKSFGFTIAPVTLTVFPTAAIVESIDPSHSSIASQSTPLQVGDLIFALIRLDKKGQSQSHKDILRTFETTFEGMRRVLDGAANDDPEKKFPFMRILYLESGAKDCHIARTEETAFSIARRVGSWMESVSEDSDSKKITVAVVHGGVMRAMYEAVTGNNGKDFKADNLSVYLVSPENKTMNELIVDNTQSFGVLDTFKNATDKSKFIAIRHCLSTNNDAKQNFSVSSVWRAANAGRINLSHPLADPPIIIKKEYIDKAKIIAGLFDFAFQNNVRFCVSPMVRTLQTYALIRSMHLSLRQTVLQTRLLNKTKVQINDCSQYLFNEKVADSCHRYVKQSATSPPPSFTQCHNPDHLQLLRTGQPCRDTGGSVLGRAQTEPIVDAKSVIYPEALQVGHDQNLIQRMLQIDKVDSRLQERRTSSSDDLESPVERLRKTPRLLNDPIFQTPDLLNDIQRSMLLFLIHFVVQNMIVNHDMKVLGFTQGEKEKVRASGFTEADDDRIRRNVNTLLRRCE